MRDIYTLANAASRRGRAAFGLFSGPAWWRPRTSTAALSRAPLVERLYCDLSDNPFGDWYEPVDGFLALADRPGLGVDPDLRLWTSCAWSEAMRSL